MPLAGLPLHEGLDLGGLAGELHAGDVAQADLRAVGVHAQQHLLELLPRLEPGLRRDGGGEALPLDGGQAAELPGRDLRVLGLDGARDVARREPVVEEPVRVEPDPHGVLRAEDHHLADAGDAAQLVLQRGVRVVGDVVAGHRPVARHEPDHDEEGGAGLGDADALPLHVLRQPRQRELQLVLHLHLRDVGVGARLEGERDLRVAGRVARRGHVAQVVEPVHALLDDLRDRVLEGLRGRAGVARLDADRRRGDGRVLRDRQEEDRERAGHHHDDRDDPREDGTVDEEPGHGSPWSSDGAEISGRRASPGRRPARPSRSRPAAPSAAPRRSRDRRPSGPR